MIIRGEKRRWTTVDNIWVKDITLSAKAKGILLYLLSLPDDWELFFQELVTHFSEGKDAIRSGLQELMDRGFVTCQEKRSDEGKFIGNDYTIYENPHTENPNAETPPLLNTKEKLSTNNKLCATPEQVRIIAYLNEKLGLKSPKGFKDTNQQTLKNLNARLKDYTETDVKAVIDIKCTQWLGNRMQTFLRPITLFNVNKFESYVNEIDIEGSESRGTMPLQELE